jgi:hypothetical protein
VHTSKISSIKNPFLNLKVPTLQLSQISEKKEKEPKSEEGEEEDTQRSSTIQST